ncbi:MAG: hypothetical protein GX085_00520 [Firmicutes bacterium]|nr:hypothetical protein [Bacillota bacterium]
MAKQDTSARARNGRDGWDRENTLSRENGLKRKTGLNRKRGNSGSGGTKRARLRRLAVYFSTFLALAAVLGGGFLLLKDRLFPPALSLPEGVKVSAAWRVEAEGPFMIGDLIPVSLEIEGVSDVKVRQLPLSAADLGGLELVKEEEPVTRARKGGWRRRTRYLFTAWRTGDYRLRADNITYYTADGEEAKVAVEPMELTVVSVLPADLTPETASLKEDKGPVGLPPNYRPLLLALVTGFFLVLLFLLVRRFLRRHGKGEEAAVEDLPPPEPAHVIARRRLAALRAADLLATGRIKEYYSELSFCLREYLENRYHLPALEMTSGEILNSPVKAGLPLDQQVALAEVLEVSDLVKFAKHRPAEETAAALFSLVEEFVEATKEEPPAEEEAQSEEKGALPKKEGIPDTGVSKLEVDNWETSNPEVSNPEVNNSGANKSETNNPGVDNSEVNKPGETGSGKAGESSA